MRARQRWEAPLKDDWADHIERARAIGEREGTQGLWKHALVGRTCGCRDCFCCACMVVRDGLAEEARKLRLALQSARTWRSIFERRGDTEEAEALGRQLFCSEARLHAIERGLPEMPPTPRAKKPLASGQ